VRDRAVQFSIFIGAATAFLVGSALQGVSHSHRDAIFYAIAGIATATSGMAIWLLFRVLNPSVRNLWNYRISSRLLNDWVESENKPPSKADYIMRLADYCDEMRGKNEILLASLRVSYRWLMVFGSAQISFWTVLVWAKA